MTVAEPDVVEQYMKERRIALKRIVKHLREEAGFSKQALAQLLGCARTRIIDVEKEESTSEYSIAELELLAALCGRHPLEVLRLTGQEAIALGGIISAKQTGAALLGLIDCHLPERMTEMYTDSDYFPAHVVFSPAGTVLAAVASSGEAERWRDSHEFDDPYQYIIAVWNARTGDRIAELTMPYVGRIAVIDENRLAIATARPLREVQDDRDDEGEYRLQVWNVGSNAVEREIELLDRVGNLAVSPDGAYLAAFFPTTTTVQVWQTAQWKPVLALELETLKGDLDSLGSRYRPTVEVKNLPRERKVGRWIMEYSADRFEFMDNDVLVIGFGKRISQFSMSSRHGQYESPIEYPLIPWRAVTHVRVASGEIAVTKIDHNHHAGESQVELYYLEPRGNRYPPDTYIQLLKMLPGQVHQPLIVDAECILSLVDFPTPYRWGMFYKQRTAVCNLISGRMVMLSDAGRLRDGDELSMPRLSPNGSYVAYWVLPYEKGAHPRLSVQEIDATPLRGVKERSLVRALERHRRRRLQNQGDW